MRELLNAYVDGKELVLLRRTADMKVVEERRQASWACFVRVDELGPNLRRGIEASRYVVGVKQEGDYLRVDWNSYEMRKLMCDTRTDGQGRRSPFAQKHIKVYEGDVHPVRRFLVDEDVEMQTPRRCYLDIETDSRSSFVKVREGKVRVLCWTLVDEDEKVVAQAMLEEDTDAAERPILAQLWKAIEDYDQVVAWSSKKANRMDETFDFRVCKMRSRALGVKLPELRRWIWVDHCKVFLKMNSQVAQDGEEKASYKLGAIAAAVTKGASKKDDFNARKTWHAWELKDPIEGPCPGCGKAHAYSPRACLLKYNEQDAVLMPKIEKQRPYLALLDAISKVCQIVPDSGGANALTQVDTFLLRLGRQRGHRFPTLYRDEEEAEQQQGEGIRGAYNLLPKRAGIVRNVHVFDFSRLYPSLMISFNMSEETKDKSAPLNGQIAPGLCRAPTTGISFRTEPQGIVPFFLLEIAKRRKEWVDKKAKCTPGTPEFHHADRMSSAYKVMMNAAFGIIASEFSRYFDPEIAESITQTGVWLIKKVLAKIDEHPGWEAIAGGTDSGFAHGPTEQEAREFVKMINAEFRELLARYGCKHLDVSLAYEKEFDRIFWSASDGVPTANRYCGKYAHYKGERGKPESEPEIKGLELKKGDTNILARHLQDRAIRMVLGDWVPPFKPPVEDAEAYRVLIAKARDHVLQGSLRPKDVTISKGINKPGGLKGYVQKLKQDGTPAAQPPHVAVGKVLEARGEDVSEGSKIAYVVVDASDGIKAIPADDYVAGETQIDRYYLWESLVWPATKRVLDGAFPGQDWGEFDSVRPRKARVRAEQLEAAGQGTLFGGGAPAAPGGIPGVPTEPRGSVSVPRQVRRKNGPPEPYEIRATTEQLGGKARELLELLGKHPGPRPVKILVGTIDAAGTKCAEVELDCPHGVVGSPALAAAIDRLLLAQAAS